MSRPAGVTAAAVVAIIGSVLTLAFACMMEIMARVGPFGPTSTPPVPIPQYTAFLTTIAIALVALGALGIASAIGVLRLRPWARMSMLIFAGILAGICGISVVVLVLTPLPVPAGMDPRLMLAMKPTIITIYFVPALIGVWWLIQLNTPSAKSAFVDPTAPITAAARPTSISVIGWMLVVCGALSIPPAVVGLPMLTAAGLLTGWSATLLYVVLAAVQLAAGSGLLRLHESARVLAIVWFLVVSANALGMGFLVSANALFARYQAAMHMAQPFPGPIDMTSMARVGAVVGVMVAAIPVWFLVKRRDAFRADPAHS